MTTRDASESLFGRKISLIAYGTRSDPGLAGSTIVAPSTNQTTPQDGIDLSQMHISFSVYAPDAQTPKTAIIRVFNLSDGATSPNGKPSQNTAGRIQNEFSRVVLQAGYEHGPFGVIFDGTIKQVRRGRLNATDTYVDIYAADGDLGINFATVNTTLAAQANTPRGRASQLAQAFEPYGVKLDPNTFDPKHPLRATGGIIPLPRGKVMFGMASDHARQLAADQNMTWHVENGVLKFVPFNSYLPGEIVVLTSRTGLIGVPEATQDGVKIISLLNPKVRVGSRVQIDNQLLNQTKVVEPGFPSYSSVSFFADESKDGVYRVLVIEHVGDTRGRPWYTNLTCLDIDQSAPAATSVNSAG
jgi:hypothetical protein